ncbi:hypothetical protein [Hoeflea sp.]|uniref:hypothetical protein n=1 Tax=Hoeflea sp. TaxID=1940281 RepID=UPI003B01C684
MALGIRSLVTAPAALAVLVVSAFAQDDTDKQIGPCIDAVGTFLTLRKIPVEGQSDFVMRSLISLTNGGHAFLTDSSQGGVLDYQPFSSARGVWRCDDAKDGTVNLSAYMLDFTFPTEREPDALIARLDISAEYVAASGSISGITRIRFVPLDGDPLDTDQMKDPIEYEFTGTKMKMPD